MSRPLLVAFDFDHTICEDNSDIVSRRLTPLCKIPKSVKGLYESEGWTVYMAKVFELLHENNIDASCIKDAIGNIPSVPGIKDLLLELHSKNCEIIVISDSNSLFIETWLARHELNQTVTKVYTNPAKFDENGLLKIEMYHFQDWCKLSEKNMCKGYILESHINKRKAEGVVFQKVAYIGDGRNDLCPILKLSKTDMAFPRLDHTLIKLIRDPKNEDAQKIICDVTPWENGHDILMHIKNRIFFQ